MHNTEHFKRLVGIEIEALVLELKDLQHRVITLEGELAPVLKEREFRKNMFFPKHAS